MTGTAVVGRRHVANGGRLVANGGTLVANGGRLVANGGTALEDWSSLNPNLSYSYTVRNKISIFLQSEI